APLRDDRVPRRGPRRSARARRRSRGPRRRAARAGAGCVRDRAGADRGPALRLADDDAGGAAGALRRDARGDHARAARADPRRAPRADDGARAPARDPDARGAAAGHGAGRRLPRHAGARAGRGPGDGPRRALARAAARHAPVSAGGDAREREQRRGRARARLGHGPRLEPAGEREVVGQAESLREPLRRAAVHGDVDAVRVEDVEGQRLREERVALEGVAADVVEADLEAVDEEAGDAGERGRDGAVDHQRVLELHRRPVVGDADAELGRAGQEQIADLDRERVGRVRVVVLARDRVGDRVGPGVLEPDDGGHRRAHQAVHRRAAEVPESSGHVRGEGPGDELGARGGGEQEGRGERAGGEDRGAEQRGEEGGHGRPGYPMARTEGLRMLAARSLPPILLSVLVAWACASTKLTSTWRDPAIDLPPFRKVVGLAMTANPTLRRIAEDEFVRAVGPAHAVAGYALVPDDELRDRDAVRARLEAAGVDGAVVY